MATLSTAGAVPVKNEKGEIAMQKVKVNRYVAGKRPQYAPEEFSDSDEELELDLASKAGQPADRAVSYVESGKDAKGEEEESYTDDEQIEEALKSDPRWRRLVTHRHIDEEDQEAKVARHHKVHVEGQEVKISKFQTQEDHLASSAEEEEDISEEERQRRRAEVRRRALQKEKEENVCDAEIVGADSEEEEGGEEGDEEEETESEYDEYTDSEEETVPRLKPIFVSKKERATLIAAEEEARRQEQLEIEEKQKQEERRKQTVKLVEELIRLEVEQENKKPEEDVYDLNSIMTDDENEELAYEMWKVRELKRIKRDREEREMREREKAEIDRVHNMTEEERRAYLRANPKVVTNKQNKGKYKYLQKYFHRGAFYLDHEDDVYKRDFAEPTLEDHFDRTVLPQVMQVKNFGKAGRTKWTHLVAEDTTDFHSPWVADSVQNLKFHHKHAAASREIFDRPGVKRRKAAE